MTPEVEELEAFINGTSQRSWLVDGYIHSGFVWGMNDFDRKGDLTEFLFQLKRLVPESIRPHIDDFFERWQLKPTRKNARIPSYYGMSSDREEEIAFACAIVRDLRDEGMEREAALSRVAREYKIPKRKLRGAYDGRRGSSRRRRPPA